MFSNVQRGYTQVQNNIVIDYYKAFKSYFFDPEVQRAWHMLILSPMCYRYFSPNLQD